MYFCDNYALAVVFCVVTMFCWGSWGNTQKLVGNKSWRYELFYWDYVIGLLLFSAAMGLTLGSWGENAQWGFIANLKATYAEMKRRGTTLERFRLEQGSTQLDPLHAKVDGFHVVPLCANGRLLMPDGKVVDLYRDWLASAKPQEPNENPFSIGLRFEYGKFRFYAAGDFSDHHVNADGSRFEAEDEMAKVCGPCQVAKVNHHGYHSMSDRLLAALKSRVYIACMWDQLHMTRDTMRRLADCGNYPGERLICPAILTSERRQEDAAESWLAGIPKELYMGTHIVLDVPPGGETYSLAFIDAADESMRVKSVLDFQT